jgi:hypothetical protein
MKPIKKRETVLLMYLLHRDDWAWNISENFKSKSFQIELKTHKLLDLKNANKVSTYLKQMAENNLVNFKNIRGGGGNRKVYSINSKELADYITASSHSNKNEKLNFQILDSLFLIRKYAGPPKKTIKKILSYTTFDFISFLLFWDQSIREILFWMYAFDQILPEKDGKIIRFKRVILISTKKTPDEINIIAKKSWMKLPKLNKKTIAKSFNQIANDSTLDTYNLYFTTLVLQRLNHLKDTDSLNALYVLEKYPSQFLFPNEDIANMLLNERITDFIVEENPEPTNIEIISFKH